ncbi:hypothetical protein [Arsukibacterium sp.]|uniref:hypothetical protein n=1 Tax=Arsukibacterium sp. TaxID=1977258 RepID=UPI002FD9BADC
MIETFIEQKTQQLIFYVSRFLRGRLAHQELHLFVWDTLEEWAQLSWRPASNLSYRERVFWHLLHQLEYWPEPFLRDDKLLRSNIQDCICYLKGKGRIPRNCVGVRP